MHPFRQRRGLAVRTYTLGDAAITIRHTGVLRRSESIVPYDRLTDERFSTTSYSRGWLITTVVLVFLAVVMINARLEGDNVGAGADLFYLGAAVLSGLAFLQSWSQVTGIVGYDTTLGFWAGKPTPDALEDFIDELLRRRAGHLRRSYQPMAAGIADELEKLAGLRAVGVLSETEFEDLKRRLIGSAGSEQATESE